MMKEKGTNRITKGNGLMTDTFRAKFINKFLINE
jgi:hypothetical protein